MCASDLSFSIIIPQRNSLATLQRLFNSIPELDEIEIILVDNSINSITKEQIGITRDYNLYWACPERFAGGARNVGIENAHGKWLIFADADDYFSDGAFTIFNKYKESDSDVIYFCADGLYPETGERSDSTDVYTRLVQNYIEDSRCDINLRISYHVPWAKMVKREYVEQNGFIFDEVIANNDDYFAMLIGLNAKKIEAYDEKVYIYTVIKGSLTKRRSYEIIKARYQVVLRKNKYLKEHQLSEYQGSIMFFLYMSKRYGIRVFFEFIGLLYRYRQNPFVGCTNWINTIIRHSKFYIKNKPFFTE